MRTVVFGGASSLDNFFAREDGAVDWLMWSDETAEIMSEMWPRFDVIIMGRKTYEQSLKYVQEGGGQKGPFADIQTYVFSRTLAPGNRDGVEFKASDPADLVRELKQKAGKDICIMGGGDLARTLFAADVIDEVGFNIHPVLLGRGIPIFYEMEKQIDLELIEGRILKNGCVYVRYRVKH